MFTIIKNRPFGEKNFYTIRLDNIVYNGEIAKNIGLSLEQYMDILNQYGTCKYSIFGFGFETKKDAEKVIKLLEPHLVMAKLIS